MTLESCARHQSFALRSIFFLKLSVCVGVVALILTPAHSMATNRSEMSPRCQMTFGSRQMTHANFLYKWTPLSPSVASKVSQLFNESNGTSNPRQVLRHLQDLKQLAIKDLNAPIGFNSILARRGWLGRSKVTSTDILVANETALHRAAELEADLLALTQLAGFEEPLAHSVQHKGWIGRLSEPARKALRQLLYSERSALWNWTRRIATPLLKGATDFISFLGAFIIGRPIVSQGQYPSPLTHPYRARNQSKPEELSLQDWHRLQRKQLDTAVEAILAETQQSSYLLRPLHLQQQIQYAQAITQKLFVVASVTLLTTVSASILYAGSEVSGDHFKHKAVAAQYRDFSHEDLVQQYQLLIVLDWSNRGEWSETQPEYSAEQIRALQLATHMSVDELITKLDALRSTLGISIHELKAAREALN